MQSFENQLERAMRAAGLHKQQALAEESGISQPMISRFMTGAAKPTLEQLDKLAKACGVNRYALIGGTEIAVDYPAECIVTLEPEARIKWLAYFASGLTNLTEAERTTLFAEAVVVRGACETISALLYEPRLFTDPVANKEVTAERVFTIDHAQVSRSHFVVLHAGHPSFGAGQELEIARNAGIPVVLLQPRAVKVSRMVLGTSVRMHHLEYGNQNELAASLAATLERLVADLARRHTGAKMLPESGEYSFAGRLSSVRTGMKLDAETLASLTGLQTTAIENFEKGWDRNPSLAVLNRLAQVLQTTVAYLVDGLAPRIEDQDPIARDSFANLLEYGRTKHVPYDEIQKLWDREGSAYREQRHAVAEARSAAVSVDGWQERHRAHRGGGTPRQGRLNLDD